jgi:Domain of unknown function (DUF4190)
MGDDAHSGWLPPQAPGAAPPRRWESLPEAPEVAPHPPADSAPGPVPAPRRPPAAGWWQEEAAPVQPQWGAARVAARPAGNGAAVASLVLGVTGLLLFFFAGFGLLFVLNLPCSIMAWIFGVQAKRKLDRGETTERRGMAQAGLALGVVGTIVGGLAIVAWALGFIFSDDLRDEFRREWDKQQANR